MNLFSHCRMQKCKAEACLGDFSFLYLDPVLGVHSLDPQAEAGVPAGKLLLATTAKETK